MAENNFSLQKTLTMLLDEKKYHSLRDILSTMNPADIAAIFDDLDQGCLPLLFRLLPKELAAETFVEMEPEAQELLIRGFSDSELKEVIDELYVDDAVDMMEELPANVVKRVLKQARPETRRLINQFLQYPENSVGSIMTAEFVDLKKDTTAGEAIQRIRKVGEDCEAIYTCYVTDSQRVLKGVITLRELLLADENQPVGENMETDIVTVQTTDDRELAVSQMMHYDFLTLPVVDRENRLVGVVTVDDAMDVMEEEATEDFEKMAAMAPSEKPYLKTGVFTLAKNRIVWLLVLMLSGMITGGILGRYEAAFAVMPILVTFIPMLTDTGGNAGSQSSTLVIRGMAVGEITLRDFPRVLWKELRVSIVVGLALAAANYVRLMIQYPGSGMVCLTVTLAMFATVVIAKTVGGVLPMAAKLLHADPAIMAAPLITTIVDALSLMVYFTAAQRLLHI